MKNITEDKQPEQEMLQLEIDCQLSTKKEVPEITENDLWPERESPINTG